MEFSIVAFIDVLGFSSMVMQDARNHSPVFLPVFKEIIGEVRASFSGANDGLDVRMFSDSIIVSAPLETANFTKVLAACADLQRRFLARGILLRGGVSFGKHYADEFVMFSDGLITAYQIECKQARYPRIVVDSNVIDYFTNFPNLADDVRTDGYRRMLRDRDRVFFVHYLTRDEFEARTADTSQLIQRQLGAPEAVLEKLRWLHDYQRFCAQRYALPGLEIPSLFSSIQDLP